MSTGFRFKGTGVVERIDTFVTKQNKAITSIVIEIPDDKYPQHVSIKLFGKLADLGRAAAKGSVVEIVGRVGGRDWNGRVFDELVAESLEVVGEPTQASIPSTSVDPNDLPPF